MRTGRHFAVFTMTGSGTFGVVRPVKINESDFDNGGLDSFSPELHMFWGYLSGKQTERWSDSNFHCCCVGAAGYTSWYDWTGAKPIRRIDGFQRNASTSFLLDLNKSRSHLSEWSKAGDAERWAVWGVLLVCISH